MVTQGARHVPCSFRLLPGRVISFPRPSMASLLIFLLPESVTLSGASPTHGNVLRAPASCCLASQLTSSPWRRWYSCGRCGTDKEEGLFALYQLCTVSRITAITTSFPRLRLLSTVYPSPDRKTLALRVI